MHSKRVGIAKHFMNKPGKKIPVYAENTFGFQEVLYVSQKSWQAYSVAQIRPGPTRVLSVPANPILLNNAQKCT